MHIPTPQLFGRSHRARRGVWQRTRCFYLRHHLRATTHVCKGVKALHWDISISPDEAFMRSTSAAAPFAQGQFHRLSAIRVFFQRVGSRVVPQCFLDDMEAHVESVSSPGCVNANEYVDDTPQDEHEGEREDIDDRATYNIVNWTCRRFTHFVGEGIQLQPIVHFATTKLVQSQ
ncbi:unnamed protein product [Chondrus crispus]|uniref:Uncharacterized protein n=1 Tax=Chondrus crispus TaxID=2769 RepID=R7QK40_CHOCR|nr:unnamed protein product [Chondrus crispus]CDF37775.1 unnamed protein product [Chondrus crispus]|eukprot:XP_005717646.1 unnamed protein product [Chondrus crispus]